MLGSRPSPSAILHSHGSTLTGLLYSRIVLVGLFKQTAKVLLGAIEQQLTLSDHSKAICLPRLTISTLFNSRVGQIVTKYLFLQRVLYLPKYAVFAKVCYTFPEVG